MIELPLCCHRQYVGGKRPILCHSPKFCEPPNRVTEEFCAEKCHCPNADCGQAPPRPAPGACVHLGGPTGETDSSSTPSSRTPSSGCLYRLGETGRAVPLRSDRAGKIRAKVYGCSLHGQCTLGPSTEPIVCCCRCKDRLASMPYGGTPIRNLIYHVYPIRQNGMWQRQVQKLKDHLHLFNGKKIIGIGYDHRTDPPEAVQEFLGDFAADCEFIIKKNTRKLREVATMNAALPRVHTDDPAHITFLGHAKCVTHPEPHEEHTRVWADMIYEASWDYLALVEQHLLFHTFCGAFKKVGRGFRGSQSTWHYSGGMYWFRNAFLEREARFRWHKIDQKWWGSESYPGVMTSAVRGASLVCEGKVPTLNMYNPHYVRDEIVPLFSAWKLANAKYRNK